MSSEESATSLTATQELLDSARMALERYQDVEVDDDGALTFRHSDVPCAVQAVELSILYAVFASTVTVVSAPLRGPPSVSVLPLTDFTTPSVSVSVPLGT